jgi:hypothetical protein
VDSDDRSRTAWPRGRSPTLAGSRPTYSPARAKQSARSRKAGVRHQADRRTRLGQHGRRGATHAVVGGELLAADLQVSDVASLSRGAFLFRSSRPRPRP